MLKYTTINHNPPPVVSSLSISLRPSTRNIVSGCPGVPRSIPRIESVLEIRSRSSTPFNIKSVSVEVITVQEVIVPATIGSSNIFREYKIYGDDHLFSPHVSQFMQEVLALDIPFVIPIPKDVMSSGKFPHWNSSTINKLVFKINHGLKGEILTEEFPISIKRYDTLPLYRQYNEPVTQTSSTSDNQVIIDLSIPISSVGPKDVFSIYIKIMANSLHNRISKKLKLKKLSFEITEILECLEGGLPPKKEHIICSSVREFHDTPLTTTGINTQFEVEFPVENDFLNLYSKNTYSYLTSLETKNNHTIATNTITHDKLDEGIPVTHTQGFTTWGKLFTIRYEIVIKVKLHHGKDTEIRLPLTVCPYDRISSNYLLEWIIQECDSAKRMFGKDPNVDMKKFKPKPTIYHNTLRDWVKLGLSEESFGSKGRMALQYID